MLLRKIYKENYIKLKSKENDILKTNKNIYDIFIKNNFQNKIDINKCFNEYNFSIKDFENILKLNDLDENFLRKIINESNFDSHTLMNLLLENNSKYNNFDINNVFDYLYRIKTENNYFFNEEDLKILYKENKNTNFLSSQKNIDFIFDDEYYDEKILKDLVLNKNLTNKTINYIINKNQIFFTIFSNNELKNSFIENIKLDSKIIDDLISKGVINSNNLLKNKNLTEELLLKYIPEEKYNKLFDIKLSKQFLKKYIDKLNDTLIFSNLSDDISIEYFIINIINNELTKKNLNVLSENYENEKNTIIFNKLEEIKLIKKINIKIYDNVLNTFGIDSSSIKYIEKYAKLFNEETPPDKLFFYFYYIINKENNKTLNIEDVSTIKEIIKYCDIPDKIIENNYRLLSSFKKNKNNDDFEVDYNDLLSNQKIPKNLLLNQIFLKETLNDNLRIFLRHQIENKKELHSFINLIKKININEKTIKSLERKEYINSVLLDNRNYIVNELKNNEIIDMILKSSNKLNYYYLFKIMRINNENMKLIPDTSNFGISLY